MTVLGRRRCQGIDLCVRLLAELCYQCEHEPQHVSRDSGQVCVQGGSYLGKAEGEKADVTPHQACERLFLAYTPFCFLSHIRSEEKEAQQAHATQLQVANKDVTWAANSKNSL